MKTKAELLADLAVSRQALGADLPELYCRCNPVARLQRSVARNPAGWITAAAILGLVGSKWLRSDSRKRSHAVARKGKKAIVGLFPLLAWLFKSALVVAKPEAEKVLRSQISALLGGDERPAGPPSTKTPLDPRPESRHT